MSGRDNTGVALWIALAAGGLMAAAAYGDMQDLASMMDAGVILACGSAIALLSRWVSRGQVPGSVTPITDAPTALELAADNERRVEELELRADIADFRADEHAVRIALVFRAIAETNAEAGYPAPDLDCTVPLPKLRLVPPDRLQAG